MRRYLRILGALALLVAGATYVRSAGNLTLFPPPNCSEASQIIPCLNQLIVNLNSSSYQGSLQAFSQPRNLLDNGAIQVNQRGSTTATCALNGAAIATVASGVSGYSADRWGCEVNVAVGAGQLSVITATPSPPPGFQQSLKQVRNSGALTQPQCTYQEIPTYKSVQIQGQTVTFSAYIQALAGLAADQGTATQTANLVIISGTGTDQGFGTWTASPAITPAWTGIATAVNQSVSLPSTPAWARYSATATIPATATEVGVAVCWTPTATGAGTTDGIAFTGLQLEVGSAVSPYEFRTPAQELVEAQRYFFVLAEPASGVQTAVTGNSTSATVAAMSMPFPVQMRAAPTLSFVALPSNGTFTTLSGSTFTNKCGNVNNALATTFAVVATANTVTNASLTVTSSGSTIGFGCVLVGAGGGGALGWSADF